jgi:hypothetical protein
MVHIDKHVITTADGHRSSPAFAANDCTRGFWPVMARGPASRRLIMMTAPRAAD